MSIKITFGQNLDKVFDLNAVKNVEIKLRMCVKERWHDKLDAVFHWLNVIGRMKSVRPFVCLGRCPAKVH